MVDLWGVEFRRLNLASRYPFDDRATLTTTTGQTLGADAFLDLEIGLPGPPARVAMTSIRRSVESARVAFGWADDPDAASATFPLTDPPEVVDLLDAAGVAVGTLVVDGEALAALQAWPEGLHPFPEGSADLVVSTLTPVPPAGVAGLADDAGSLAAGEVWLVGRDGVVLEADEHAGTIRVNAVGDPLASRAACDAEESEFAPPGFIKTINGIGPDTGGRFIVTAAGLARGSTILRVEPAAADAILIGLSTAGRGG